jgi:hypothetical protein
MSLILPPFYFADCTDNFSGTTPAAASPGATVTASASTNTDGTAASVIAAVGHDIHFLVVGIGNTSTTATVDSAALLDILVDPAGGTSWSSLIDDLVCGFSPILAAGIGYSAYYMFPLFIKSGASIGAQVRCATGSQSFRVGCWVYGNPSRPEMWWCGSKVESLGINAASSKGTDITPGSTTATFTWTNVGSTTTGRYGAIQFGHNGSDNNATTIGYHAQIGIGSARVPGTPTFIWQNSTSENTARSGFCMPIWCDIPEGTQLQVGACASGTAEVHDVALYGVY